MGSTYNFPKVAVSILIMATLMRAADANDGWGNLKEVTQGRQYTVRLRDGRCEQGRLGPAGAQSFSLRTGSGKDLVVTRADVLRVSDRAAATAHDAIFSGRSSWLDVREAYPSLTERIRVVTRRGEERTWIQPKVSDDSMSVEGTAISKTGIQSVSYLRFRPYTDREEDLVREDVRLLSPRFWFNGLMLGKISVLLYSSGMPEDNSLLRCR
jgi:hypothetical protein